MKALPLLASASLAACLAAGCLPTHSAPDASVPGQDAATVLQDAAIATDTGSAMDASPTSSSDGSVDGRDGAVSGDAGRSDGGVASDGGATGDGGGGTSVLAKLRNQTMYSSKPTGAATWLVNGDTGSVRGQINNDMNAAGTSKFPVFTLYHFYMASNTSASAYHDWVSQVAEEIGKHSGNAVVVVEPDSFALKNVSGVDGVLDDAVAVLKQKAPNAAVFLDIGHSNWLSAGSVVSRAKTYAHYDQIDGWASNTSNFQPEANEEAYGKTLFTMSGKPDIIDSSRNGLGTVPSTIINPPASEWKEGPKFAFHPEDSGVLFNYYNKPSNERD